MSTLVQAPEAHSAEMVSPVVIETTGLSGNERTVDFNLILQEALKKCEGQLGEGKAIIRCDNLPEIIGDEKDLKQLCSNLIDLILHHSPQTSKLFIYIKCNQADTNQVHTEEKNGMHFYEICFHTNSCKEPLWQAASQEQISQCEAICKKHKGSFNYAYGNADYLFKLTLPGK